MTTHLDDLVTEIKAAKSDAIIKRIVSDAIQNSHIGGCSYGKELIEEAHDLSGPWMKPNPYPEE